MSYWVYCLKVKNRASCRRVEQPDRRGGAVLCSRFEDGIPSASSQSDPLTVRAVTFLFSRARAVSENTAFPRYLENGMLTGRP